MPGSALAGESKNFEDGTEWCRHLSDSQDNRC
jgi:hypothetical protein